MVNLFDSELLENKSVYLSLTNIYGLGKSNSSLICKRLGFSAILKVKHLSAEQINEIVKALESLDIKLSSNLKKLKMLSKKKLIFIKCYRGLRKIRGLPIRGQRTHGSKFVNNARFKDIRQTTYLKTAEKRTAIICSSIGQCIKTRLNAISFPTAINTVCSYRRLSVGIYFPTTTKTSELFGVLL